MHAAIAQDGPETALCKSPFSADAAVLEVSTALRFESAALLATPACVLITSKRPGTSTTLNNESINAIHFALGQSGLLLPITLAS
jgi:hypothetical protein